MNLLQHICAQIIACMGFCAAAQMVAYDCDPKQIQNTTEFPELEVVKCENPSEDVAIVNKNIHILHYNSRDTVQVHQCKIKMNTLRMFCDEITQTYPETSAFAFKNRRISRKECKTMHRKQTIMINKKRFKVAVNRTTYLNYIQNADVDKHGNCHVENGSSVYQVIVEVTLRQSWLEVDTSANRIFLPNGMEKNYFVGKYYDPQYGHSFWDRIRNKYCLKHRYAILYKGPAAEYHSKTLNLTMFYQSNKDIDFAIPISKDTYTVCDGTKFHRTIYNDLLIVLDEDDLPYYRAARNFRQGEFIAAKSILEMDIMSEKLNSHWCQMQEQEKQINYMLADENPEEFAYFRMRQLGYTSSKCGGFVQIMKCREVEVKERSTEQCYDHTPIVYDERNVFMTARTHVIKTKAKEVNCSLKE